MKRDRAGNDNDVEETKKVAQMDELQELVGRWAKREQDGKGWLEALKGQDIETMQSLQDLSSNEAC